MPKKNTRKTPRGKIRSAIRQLWMKCRERSSAEKDQKYTCQRCGKKKSVAKGREVKTEVHHRTPCNWEGVIDIIIDQILMTPEDYEVLCKGCHKKEHEND